MDAEFNQWWDSCGKEICKTLYVSDSEPDRDPNTENHSVKVVAKLIFDSINSRKAD